MTDKVSMAEYNYNVERIREQEYPMLKDAIYLDHAGTTLYSKSLMERFTTDMLSNLYGNPHSASASSQLSTRRIEDIRLRVLQFCKADPEDFEVVFVANATAGIKLVMEAFRGYPDGFIYRYHKDAHTSLVGVRESAQSSHCLTDGDVENWLSGSYPPIDRASSTCLTLFAYPAQSNMDGRRLPLSWPADLRYSPSTLNENIFILLDAAALASTAQVDLSDANAAPDFTVLSFYKIFGFPDLGALIVRKASGHILRSRKYFGGGTVDMVVSVKEKWHIPKKQSIYESLEDGTLPIHNIMALETALNVHEELFESMDRISQHTSYLASRLYQNLRSLRHANGELVCKMYSSEASFAAKGQSQGPVVAFNLRSSDGAWMSNTEVEKLASLQRIHVRTGGLCNPGGLATAINLEPWEMKRNFSAGFRCGNENDIIGGKPTGIIRVSLGAMSTISDIDAFVVFIREFYVDCNLSQINATPKVHPMDVSGFFVESMSIYPIKSCGGMKIPPGIDWEIRKEGLAWDREWCLIHLGTGQALNQKRCPRMALIRPTLDFKSGLLRVKYHGPLPHSLPSEICVALSADPNFYEPVGEGRSRLSRVCGDVIAAHTYSSQAINDFFSRILNVQCTLARFPAGGLGPSIRHSKAHMQKHQGLQSKVENGNFPGAISSPLTPPDSDTESARPILLSNESPVLLINRSSVNALNEEIEKTGGKPASASVFRANIIVASSSACGEQNPYSEDHWSSIHIGQQVFKMLGSCRRCHMICVDQDTADKNCEPFVTLTKTRRFDGKVFFGSHMCHNSGKIASREQQYPTIRIGDPVTVCFE